MRVAFSMRDYAFVMVPSLKMGFLPANPAYGANGVSAPFSRRNDSGIEE